VIGLIALYSGVTFALCVADVVRTASPRKALEQVSVDGPRPRGNSMKADIREFIVLVGVFGVCWHYLGDASDMPRHLLRITTYTVGAWVVFSGMTMLYVVMLRGLVWWRWIQLVITQHEQRLAEQSQTGIHQGR
jgi:hypothetical protein